MNLERYDANAYRQQMSHVYLVRKWFARDASTHDLTIGWRATTMKRQELESNAYFVAGRRGGWLDASHAHNCFPIRYCVRSFDRFRDTRARETAIAACVDRYIARKSTGGRTRRSSLCFSD